MTSEKPELEHVEQPALEGETSESWWSRFETNRWAIVVLLLGAGALVVLNGGLPKLPSSTGLVVVTFVSSLVVAWVPASKIVDGFLSPGEIILVRGEPFAEWSLTPEEFAALEVSDGELFQKKSTLIPVYEVADYDEETNVAEGTWKGSASDLELLEYENKVDEVRGQLETMAREGLAIRVKSTTIVRDAVAEITEGIVQQFESATMPDGEKVTEAVDRAADRAIDSPDDGKEQDDSLIEDDLDQEAAPDGPTVSVVDGAPATDGGSDV